MGSSVYRTKCDVSKKSCVLPLGGHLLVGSLDGGLCTAFKGVH